MKVGGDDMIELKRTGSITSIDPGQSGTVPHQRVLISSKLGPNLEGNVPHFSILYIIVRTPWNNSRAKVGV